MPRKRLYGEVVGVNITPSARSALDELAARNGRLLSDELRIAIARHLQKSGVVLPDDDPQLRLLQEADEEAA